MSTPSVVTVHILDREYPLACPQSERASLESAARYLDNRMRDMRNQGNGRTLGTERLAVLVALTVTHELLQLRAGSEPINEGDTRARMRELMAKVDRALDESVRDVQG